MVVIPAEVQSSRYQQYLASREWALKREAVRRRSGNHCERCWAGPQDAVHHLTYERLYNERLEDLQAICNACHAYESGKSHVDLVTGGVSVYLAGPITSDAWRGELTCDKHFDFDFTRGSAWEWCIARRALPGGFDLTGPFFMGDVRHGGIGWDGDEHGVWTEPYWHRDTREDLRNAVVGLCTSAIVLSNVIFAWIPKLEVYGTLWELGCACAHQKPVFLSLCNGNSRPRDSYSDLWFAQNANCVTVEYSETVSEAWKQFQHFWSRHGRRLYGTPKTEESNERHSLQLAR